MIVGVITTRDLIFHPREVFMIHGLIGSLKVLWRAMSRKQYHFIDFIEMTTRTFTGKKKLSDSE